MKQPGQIALMPFPHTDMSASELRPVLLLRKASPRYDDWLVWIGGRLLVGSIGSLHRARLQTIRRRLGRWITEGDTQ